VRNRRDHCGLRGRRLCVRRMAGGGAASCSQVVTWYIRDYRTCAREELAFYRGQPTLNSAIHVGALAIRRDGTRHPHQWRRSLSTLEAAREQLLHAGLRRCRTFEQLYSTVRDAIEGIPDIGALTVYDTAQRIGAFLGLEPDVVYLHCGTRDGARALGLAARGETLSPDVLPAAFRRLRPYEVEDCLCIYKRELAEWRAAQQAVGPDGRAHG